MKETEGPLRESLNAIAARSGSRPADKGIQVVSFKPYLEENSVLRHLHDRLQAMPLLYVDGANYIDNTDPKWEVYLALSFSPGQEEEKSSQQQVCCCGFATVYSFYAYPSRERLRLSQILVFPPYRRRGAASGILEKVYSDAVAKGALDLTVEDPSEEFQALRENIDVRRLTKTKSQDAMSYYVGYVQDALRKSKDMVANGMKPETLLLPSRAVYDKAERELKIHRAQLRKVWEVVLLRQLRASEWSNAEEVVKKIVTQRLSSQVSERKLEEASKNKHVIDRNEDNFIMTRVFTGRTTVPKRVEVTDEEKQKSMEYDLQQIGNRMDTLQKLVLV